MRDSDYFAGASTRQDLAAPASIAANTTGAGVDITSFQGDLMAVLSAANTAGTTPTLDVKFQDSPVADVIGTITYSGTGNGNITEVEGGPDAVTETITVTMSSATAFAVSGSVSGSLGTGTVGTKFTSPQVSFVVNAGGTALISTDAFTVPVTARTYTDVTGAAFTQVTTTGKFQRLRLNSDGLGKYLRAVFTIGGTVSPEYIAGLTVFGMQG